MCAFEKPRPTKIAKRAAVSGGVKSRCKIHEPTKLPIDESAVQAEQVLTKLNAWYSQHSDLVNRIATMPVTTRGTKISETRRSSAASGAAKTKTRTTQKSPMRVRRRIRLPSTRGSCNKTTGPEPPIRNWIKVKPNEIRAGRDSDLGPDLSPGPGEASHARHVVQVRSSLQHSSTSIDFVEAHAFTPLPCLVPVPHHVCCFPGPCVRTHCHRECNLRAFSLMVRFRTEACVNWNS